MILEIIWKYIRCFCLHDFCKIYPKNSKLFMDFKFPISNVIVCLSSHISHTRHQSQNAQNLVILQLENIKLFLKERKHFTMRFLVSKNMKLKFNHPDDL
jgi:hypothetical protein